MSSVAFADVSPDVDVDQATRHLEVLHHGAKGFVSFVLLGNGRKERHSFARVEDLSKVSGAQAKDSYDHLHDVVVKGRWNLYTAMASFAKTPEKGRGSREDIDSLPGVWADVDVKPGTEGYFQSEDQLKEFMTRLPIPTLEIASGSGGRHLYWLTHDRFPLPQGIKILPAWLDFLRAAADGAVIENVQDSMRILRLAGTIRWPKVDDTQATVPMPVTLINDAGPRYHLDELVALSEHAATEAQAHRNEIIAQRSRVSQQRIQEIESMNITKLPIAASEYPRLYDLYEDWGDLLSQAGWTLFSDQRNGPARCRYWVRPGKEARDGKSSSTDYMTDDNIVSTRMTIYSNDPTLQPLWENAGGSDAHGICSKFHFALTVRHGGDMLALLDEISERVEREGWKLR